MDYEQFLKSKAITVESSGFEIDPDELHPSTMPHQRDAIQWALTMGRAGIFASFGLGKTHMGLEMMRLVSERQADQKVLIICPLGNRHTFVDEDGKRLGISVEYVWDDESVAQSQSQILITNYERVREGNITVKHDDGRPVFAAVLLDEGSVLRSFGSKTYKLFCQLFDTTPYRWVLTATPSPNDFIELLNYAEFLGIMDTGQALTRWFKRNSSQANELTVHPQHEEEFWHWVATWALFITKPSDLGYSDEGYDLPELRVHWHCVSANHKAAQDRTEWNGQKHLLAIGNHSASKQAPDKRQSISGRLEKLQEIMEANTGRHWLLWHHLEAEREAIEKAIPNAVTVYGSQPPDVKEKHLLAFTRGETEILATKPRIAGLGCNFQRHCYSNIFMGVEFKFEEFIQATHRTYRFGQTEPVDVHVIYLDSEQAVITALKRKWQQHKELLGKMTDIIKQYGLSRESIQNGLKRQMNVERVEVVGQSYKAILNDCVAELPNIETNSVGLIHTSIPFGNQYQYSAHMRDFGYNESNEKFFEQFDFLVPELLRVLIPGRLAAIHVKDRLVYGSKSDSGFMEIDPFSDRTIAAFRKHGFLFVARITITTDVVRENNSTYRLGYREMCKDGSKMGVGMPEYLLLFRKPPSDSSSAFGDVPVDREQDRQGKNGGYSIAQWQIDAHAHYRSSGDRLLFPLEVEQYFPQYQWETPIYNYEAHVEHLRERSLKESISSGMVEEIGSYLPTVWTDIHYPNTLNSNQSKSRNENHICPLPFDIVERTLERFSKKGDVVLDPFAGLFTVPYMSVKMGRTGVGIELNPTYFTYGVKYCQQAEMNSKLPTLFDLTQYEAAK